MAYYPRRSPRDREEAMSLPWPERVVQLSIHPDAATRDDVAKLAAELMEANHALAQERATVIEECKQAVALSVDETDYIARHQAEKSIKAISGLAHGGEGKT
jgi:hypothetical protein